MLSTQQRAPAGARWRGHLRIAAGIGVLWMASCTIAEDQLRLPVAGAGEGASPDSVTPPDSSKAFDESAYQNETLRGRVVWTADALSRRFGINSVPEARERQLCLESPDGQVVPLVEDIRGRSFRKDARLRNVDVELFVRRYTGSPLVQVIRVYALEKGEKYELDYWCEICSIAMFELKPCDCCQGPIELRRRLATGENGSDR